jgi:hypothetical protein
MGSTFKVGKRMICIERNTESYPPVLQNSDTWSRIPRSILACLISAEQSLITLSGSSVGFTNSAQNN